jgi:hypothetical protein
MMPSGATERRPDYRRPTITKKNPQEKRYFFRQSLLLLLHIGVTHAADVVLPCSRQYIEESHKRKKKKTKQKKKTLGCYILSYYPRPAYISPPKKKERRRAVYRHFGIDDNTVRPTGDTVS